MSSRPPGWPMRSSRSATAAGTTCGRRAVEAGQACRHVAGGEAAQPPCTFSPERRGVFQPSFRWRHGDEASPCRHPGGTMPPLPWSERRYIAVRSLQEAIGRKMIGNLGDGSPVLALIPLPSRWCIRRWPQSLGEATMEGRLWPPLFLIRVYLSPLTIFLSGCRSGIYTSARGLRRYIS